VEVRREGRRVLRRRAAAAFLAVPSVRRMDVAWGQQHGHSLPRDMPP